MLAGLIDELKTVRKLSGNAKISVRNTKLSEDEDYNCWGFTAFAYNWVDRLYWIDSTYMNILLDRYTYKTLIRKKNVKVGDIIIYRSRNEHDANEADGKKYLLHTGIVTDPFLELMLDKDGDRRLNTHTYYGSRYYKNYNSIITFARVIK
jgi:hypothetical protein